MRFNLIRQRGLVGGVAAAASVASASTFAAVPAAVTDSFDDLTTDLASVGGLVVVATVGVAVWKFVQAIII